jgi:hypothetical protein
LKNKINFLFDWMMKLKRKINLANGPKRMKIKIDIKNKNNIWLKGEIERIITFIKRSRKQLEIKKNKDQIEKYNTINLNWRLKLKTNKTFRKGPRKKIKIKRMRTRLENIIFGKLRLNDKIENKENF